MENCLILSSYCNRTCNNRTPSRSFNHAVIVNTYTYRENSDWNRVSCTVDILLPKKCSPEWISLPFPLHRTQRERIKLLPHKHLTNFSKLHRYCNHAQSAMLMTGPGEALTTLLPLFVAVIWGEIHMKCLPNCFAQPRWVPMSMSKPTWYFCSPHQIL